MSNRKQSPEKATYVSGEAGNAGQYKINRRDGKLEFSKTLFALEGERLPMALRLAYVQDLPAGVVTLIGGKWKFNYEQFVYAEGNGYVYIDGQGKRHDFVRLDGSAQEYYDTFFSGLLLRTEGGTVTTTDERTVTLTFTAGKLTKIQEKRGATASTTVISSAASSLTVTDGENRVCTISSSGGRVTVNKPHQSSAAAATYQIFIDRTTTGCTVTDIGGEKYTYTVLSDGSLSEIKSSFGKMVVFTYDGAAARYTKAVEQKEENNGTYVLRTYILEYGGNVTDVKTVQYASSASAAGIEQRYVFADNGTEIYSFEIKGDKPEAVRFRSDEDYRNYAAALYAEDRVECVFGLSDAQEQFNVTASQSAGGTASCQKNYFPNSCEDLVFTADAYVTESGCNTDSQEVELTFGHYDNGSNEIDLWTKTVKLYKCGGAQVIVVKIPKNIAGYAAMNNATFKYCKILAHSTGSAFRFTLKNAAFSVVPSRETVNCLNVNTGSASTFTDGGTTWYEVVPCKVGSGAAAVTMTQADWLLTLENYAKNQSNYVIWYGDKTAATRGNASTKFVFGTRQYTIGQIRYASVARQADETTVVGYTFTASTVQQTYRKIVPGKATTVCSAVYDSFGRMSSKTDSNNVKTTYTYDSYGNCTQELTAGGGKSIRRTYSYGTAAGGGSNGYYMITARDYLDGITNIRQYQYDEDTGFLKRETVPRGQVTKYDYHADGTLQKVSSALGGTDRYNSMAYASGEVSAMQHNTAAYDFTYDTRGGLKTVKNGSNTLYNAATTYSPSSVKQERSYNGTAQKRTREYDVYGRLTSVTENGADPRNFAYTYGSPTGTPGSDINANSVLRKIVNTNGTGNTLNYSYDAKGNLTKEDVESYEAGRYTTEMTYDDDNRVGTRLTTGFGSNIKETYTYTAGDAFHDAKVTVTKVEIGSTQFMNTADSYDGFDRLSSRTRTVSGASAATEAYTYTRGATDSETSLKVASVSYSYGGQTVSESYSYDKDGNIVQTDPAKYTYDLLGRLTREDNARLGKSYVYTYDEGGNITARREYAYSTGTLTTPTKTANYAYSGDRLTSYDGKTFAYNADGTPTRFKGTAAEFLRGRMTSYGNYLFDYDHNGVRRVKYSGDGASLTSFCYSGTKLLAEKRLNSPSQIVYLYDHSGIIGLQIGSTKYYYRKNLFGDIVAIYQGNTKQGEYVYDAWGNHRIFNASGVDITDNSSYNSNVLNLNPFRYRGYYFDAETKLYYLINRYYDPEIGRFMSADDIAYLAPETIGGLNLYAYCNNNPVMNTDPEGNILLSMLVVGALIGFATSFAISATVQMATEGEVNWGTALVDGAFGAITGALSVTGISALGIGLANAGLSAANSLITTGMENNWQFDMSDGLSIAGSALLSGLIGGLTRKAALQKLMPVKSLADMARTGVLNAAAAKSGVKQATAVMSRYANPVITKYFADTIIDDTMMNYYQTLLVSSVKKGVEGILD